MDFPGKYELLDRLGQGGMAELFRARAVGTGGVAKLVALKRMLPELARDEALGAMLIDEARLVSNLSHPNVVQVYELGKDGSGYYIAMELVNGPNLADVLARLREKGQRLPEPLALDVLIAVLGALDTAHRLCDASGRPAGIVHRDVSPQNVLISDAGAVKLGDFGIAKARNRVTEETQSGGIKGKLPYMAPEQIRGTGVDGRTDQFAAGLLLWECLAGQRHYVGETDMEILWKAGEGRVRPLSEVGVTVNPQLEQIVSTALAVQPDARFPSCAEFARALTVYARKTWPDHDPAELASVVRSLFGAELRERAERLHRFEAGLEPTCGWVGGPAATDTARRAALSSVPIEPTLVPRTTGRQPVIRLTEVVAPAPAREPAGGSLAVEADEARRTPVDVPRLEEAPPPQTAEELAAIDAAIAAAKHEERGPKRAAGAFRVIALAAVLLLGAAEWFVVPLLAEAPAPSPGAPPLSASPVAAPPRVEAAPLRAPEPPEPAADAREVVRTGATRPKKELRAAETRGFGTLDVFCRPGCTIEIDGKDSGLQAPAEGIVLSPGKHRVRVFNAVLRQSKVAVVSIRAGDKERADFDFAR